jgi:ABC-type sugar transport system ATPase subunit
MSSVRVEAVCKQFGQNIVLDNVSLDIADTEFVTLLGPSGSGKTTLLNIIAGIVAPDRGEIFLGDRPVSRLPSNKRNIAMVFQDYALYPHMRVRDNIGFSLKLQKQPAAQIRQRVEAVAEVVDITFLLDRRPGQLSGGQRQRVALARAMVREPDVFLLDEPLSNLDAQLRTTMRVELQKIHRNMGVTMINVTHDQEEAMSVSHRIALMQDGRIEQFGTPDELYDEPTNISVARFIGTPRMNLLKGRLVATQDGWTVSGPSFSFDVPHDYIQAGAIEDLGDVTVGIRPEDLTLNSGATPAALLGEISVIERLGRDILVYLSMQEQEIVLRTSKDTTVTLGARIGVTVRPENLHFFDGRTGKALPRPNTRKALAQMME